MHKIRQSQLMQIHQDLFEVASSWSQVRSQTLLKYVFEHGVKHALSGDQVQGMADLILDYEYDLERLRLSGSADLYGIVQDFEALCTVMDTESVKADLQLMAGFLRGKRHLLQLDDEQWGIERIFHQLALEHADESTLTQRAEKWEQNADGWVHWRRKRRPQTVPVNPCIQTLLTEEEEWSTFEQWQDVIVASDCCSYLWAWHPETNEVLLHQEVMNYACGPGSGIVLWSSKTIYMWERFDDDKPQPIFEMELADIGYVKWWSLDELLVVTESGRIQCLNLSTLEIVDVLCFDDNRYLAIDIVSEDAFVVHQDGWYDIYEEASEEWGEDEDEVYEDSEEDKIDEGDEEASEEWDEDDDEAYEDSEDECETPSDPTVQLCQRDLSSETGFVSTELCTIEHQVSTIHIVGRCCVVVDKRGTIFLYTLSGEVVHLWSLFASTGRKVHILSETHFGVVQWNDLGESSVHVLSTVSPDIVVSLDGHTDIVTDMVQVSNGRIATTSFDTTAIVWDLSTGNPVFQIHNIVPHALSGALMLNQSTMALWSVSGHILIWDVERQKQIGSLMGHTSSVSDVKQLSNGRLASSAMFEPSLRIWDPSLAPLRPPRDNHDDVIISSVPIRNGLVLTGAHDKTLRVWKADTATCLLKFTEHTEPIECMHWISDTEIVSGDWAGVLLRWNIDGNVLQRYEGHTDWVRGCTVLPNGNLLSWSDDTELRVWDMESGACLETLEGHDAPVRGGLSLGEHRWLSWSEDATLRVWSLDTWQCLMVLDGPTSQIDTVRLLGDGRIVASNYEDVDMPTVVKVWDGESGECLQTFTGLDADVIELVVVENQLYVRTSANIWSWDFKHSDQPREWLLKEFETAEPQIWRLLHPEGFEGFEGMDRVTTDGGKVSSQIDGQLIRWIGDGNWKVHSLVGTDTLVATCWNDVAFLELCKG